MLRMVTHAFFKYLESDISIADEVTIGDDADAADDGDHTYPIPNEESDTGP